MSRQSKNRAASRDLDGMPAAHRHTNSSGVGGEMAVPNSPGFVGNGHGRDRNSQPGLDLARSPPQSGSNKNTKHVPCKFFRQGACQAGNACPFSHSLDPMMHQAPCKYFMKGNCKFGAKCALAHYLPNGHRVSRADLDAGLVMGNRPGFGTNNRTESQQFQPQESAFPEAYMPPALGNQDPFPPQDQFLFSDDDFDAYDSTRYRDQHNTMGFEGLNSPPTSQFGSPPNDVSFTRQTTDTIRSALNAPLPASFDANSLPHIAKYGPFGQSVPDKFGMRSPPTSVLSKKLGSPPDNLLGAKANVGSALRNVSSPLSMSPQTGEDSISGRIMHSSKTTRPRMISASVPRTSLHDWDESAGTEGELLPNSLHDEVFLPGERVRRTSRAEDLSSSARERSDGLEFGRRNSVNVGSPPMGSSPSRFRGLFEEQRRKEESTAPPGQNFGHVGSPLRETWMPQDSFDKPRAAHISGISQAVARMELNRTESSDTNSSSRPISGLRSSSSFARSDRQISSPGLSGRRIDEEGEGGFFEMDDDGSKRTQSIWGLPQLHTQTQSRKLDDAAKSPNSNGAINIKNGTRPVFGFRP